MCVCGQTAAVEALLDAGAPLEAPDKLGRTPLHLAAAEGPHCSSCQQCLLQQFLVYGPLSSIGLMSRCDRRPRSGCRPAAGCRRCPSHCRRSRRDRGSASTPRCAPFSFPVVPIPHFIITGACRPVRRCRYHLPVFCSLCPRPASPSSDDTFALALCCPSHASELFALFGRSWRTDRARRGQQKCLSCSDSRTQRRRGGSDGRLRRLGRRRWTKKTHSSRLRLTIGGRRGYLLRASSAGRGRAGGRLR